MKKVPILLLTVLFLISSCKVTYYANNERLLKRNFINAPVEDIEYEFGSPDEIEEKRTGPSYIYYYEGRVGRSSRIVDQYTRFSFDNDGFVRDIKSTATVKTKRVSAGRTVWCVILCSVGLGVVLGLAEASNSNY